MKQLHVEGLAEDVVTVALVEYRENLAKLKKKMSEKHLGTTDLDACDKVASEALSQLGWKPKSSSVEVTDPSQQNLLLGASGEPGVAIAKARVTCQCGRKFTAPAGQHVRACPDCSRVYRVTSDDRGELLSELLLVVPDDGILKLLVRERTKGVKHLARFEVKQLEKWRKDHPERCEDPELVTRGERVADPEVPGSGNHMTIVCSSIAGNECNGFDTTDTPGVSVCPNCGQKYVVELLNERPQPRPFDPERDGDGEGQYGGEAPPTE